MKIGQKIKELRIKKNFTQEKLAELLCISFQAVSKWETGASAPDLSMIAPICNLFGVSADELLEIDVKSNPEKINSYYNVFSQYAESMEKGEAIRQHTLQQLREGLRLYPDNRLLKQQLVTVLYINGDLPECLEEKQEMCRLCGELLEDTEDLQEKSRYISMYCEYARFTGNAQQGKIYANFLPEEDLYASRDLCYALCCEDAKERRRLLRGYLLSGWGRLREGLLRLMLEPGLSAEEICRLREKQEKIYEILYDKDDVVRYGDFDEFKVARAFYLAGDMENWEKYLSVCREKWIEPHSIRKLSPWREGRPEDYELSEEERKANGEVLSKSY